MPWEGGATVVPLLENIFQQGRDYSSERILCDKKDALIGEGNVIWADVFYVCEEFEEDG